MAATLGVVAALWGVAPAPAQQAPPAAGSAPRLVREANELLLGDKPAEALRTYEQALGLRPDSREIAFDQALAHYRLGEFDKAREAFHRASAGTADALADDAQYGLGTCDHAEALSAQDPKEAVSKIESAMRNYQTVLGNYSDHALARDANLKAASYWRQLKQQLQQQEQQPQQQNQDQDSQDDQQQDQNKQDSQQDQQSRSNEQSPSPDQQEQQKESQAKEEQNQEQTEQKEQKASAQKKEEGQEKQPQEEQEDASRDQAERKLREMMQALRDRKKHRREEVKTPTYRPTEKDW